MSTLAASRPVHDIGVEGRGKGGGGRAGRRMGSTASACARRGLTRRSSPSTSATIPSKYQTFFSSSSEAKGFNIQSPRFEGTLSSDTPGPGSYSGPSSCVVCDSNSSSKRGSGGFASKAQRFKRDRKTLLGPGSYDSYLSSLNVNSSTTSSFFQKPIVNVPSPGSVQSPSPTTYTPSHSHTAVNHLVTGQAAFNSQSKRHSFLPSSSLTPSPGHYTIQDTLLHPSPHQCSSSFISHCQRVGPGIPMKGPGPADYSPSSHTHPSHPHPSHLHQHNPLSLLRPKHYLRLSAPALPLPPLPPSPGPGHYEMQASKTTRPVAASGPGSGTAFVSTTSRWRSKVNSTEEEEPGPGSYDPVGHNRKSYLYNIQKKWI